MNARFDSLTRGSRYTFALVSGVTPITGVFHEILPDGCLLVIGGRGERNTKADQYTINPDAITDARLEGE